MATRSFYRPELDGLRFLAFFLVFLHHVLPREPAEVEGLDPGVGGVIMAVTQSFGFGMTLFFLLSAFLITRLMIEEIEANGRIGIGDFYLRRALRIWPLYALAVAVGLVIVSGPEGGSGREMLAWFSVFLGNWWFLDHPWDGNPMDPLWSISVEEQFYLVLPFAVILAGRGRIVALGVGAIAFGVLAQWIQGARHLAVDTAIWVNTATHMTAFGAGIALAGLTHARTWRAGPVLRVGLVVAAFAAFFLAADVFDGKRIAAARSGFDVAMGHGLAAAGAAALLLSVLDLGRRPPAWLIHLGRISFGLYVWHLLMVRLATSFLEVPPVLQAVAAFVATVVVSHLLYVGYERPFLRLRERFVHVANRPV